MSLFAKLDADFTKILGELTKAADESEAENEQIKREMGDEQA